MLFQPLSDSLTLWIFSGTYFTWRRLISAHLLHYSDLAGVLLRRHKFNTLPRHILDLPSAQFHFLAVHNLNRRLFDSLLVALKLLGAAMRADLVILSRLFFFNIFSFPLLLHLVNV